jgi:hypothetical protein
MAHSDVVHILFEREPQRSFFFAMKERTTMIINFIRFAKTLKTRGDACAFAHCGNTSFLRKLRPRSQ